MSIRKLECADAPFALVTSPATIESMSNSGFSPRPVSVPMPNAPPPPDQVRSPLAGGIRLFEFRGITVFLHLSWIIVAAIEIQSRRDHYNSIFWNVAEYVTLFTIVLLHEFGHAFACRSVGGISNRIMLWPLGGVALADPPPRPGATLWTIAAGPLVNVALLLPLYFAMKATGNGDPTTNGGRYIVAVFKMNLGLLIFNMLPLYPLDGGQILQSLLWFVVGRTWSLLIAASIGLIGVGLFLLFAWWLQLRHFDGAIWIGLLGLFAGFQCWRALKFALAMRKADRIPWRTEIACPACGASPPALPIWKCPKCEKAIDVFSTGGTCPNCGSHADIIPCISCRQPVPFAAWKRAAPPSSTSPFPAPVGPP